ncbi:MAG: hypothetical protein KBA30_11065 [Clostridia bacterium]|nr:hypothetical protein [Clostridia bacterium]
MVLSFGLRRRVEDARIVEACEPRPGRWTHHVLITGEADLESPVRGWLLEAYRQAGGEA